LERGHAIGVMVDRDRHSLASLLVVTPASVGACSSQLAKASAHSAPRNSAAMNPGQISRPNARKGICESPRDGDGRVGERCRGREPIGRRDVCRHRKRHRRGAQLRATPDHGEQPERGHEIAKRLGTARARVAGGEEHRLAEHKMRGRDPTEGAGDLRHDIGQDVALSKRAPRRVGHRHGGVEVSSRDRPERQNQRHERSAGRQRVRQEREGRVAAREPLARDSRTDDGREQERGTPRLQRQFAGEESVDSRSVRSRRSHAEGACACAARPSPTWFRAAVPGGGEERHAGPAHHGWAAVAGLRARTKALMNFPST
jgi:hypothetical protein